MTDSVTDKADADFIPTLRPNFLRRSLDGEVLVWSPVSPTPVVLDPVSAVMLDVVDGITSIRQLADEVHEEVGISFGLAWSQVRRSIEVFQSASLLGTSGLGLNSKSVVAQRGPFLGPLTH